MTKYTFAEQQAKLDELKSKDFERTPDEYIEDKITEFTGEKAWLENGSKGLYLKPLVAEGFEENKKLPYKDVHRLLKYTTFFNKKKILKELKSGRGYGMIVNGGLKLERNKAVCPA